MALRDYKISKVKLSDEEAFKKISRWCAWQERSQEETRQQLRSYGVNYETAEQIIAELISENFLNEFRFAVAYVRGKFNIKQWGKVKLTQGLKKHKVPEALIKQSLDEIDGQVYKSTILKLIKKKIVAIGEKDKAAKLRGVINYLVSKGYEYDSIYPVLSEVDLTVAEY